MRVFIGLVLICSCGIINAQLNEKEEVKKTVQLFFEAFHDQDSTLIKSTTGSGIIMQTIGRDKEGTSVVKTSDFDDFLKSIVSIPDSIKFQEKLLSYQIKVDGSMANAWTPYELWINDSLSHCGVNSFQLHKQDGTWKIIYLIDTRRREHCN
ncbi:nuclear transport factor 2 family protein [uncultured Eudoraea sp.]|uniref:nuclear transport factor 2 family protein n=1 Tax=uncultured Eudoraea sp. TaxID=1035614 RepID=UPI0026020171|nr:nuclear transport factor 2 family protein [uncultured Eudoraea sp.]